MQWNYNIDELKNIEQGVKVLFVPTSRDEVLFGARDIYDKENKGLESLSEVDLEGYPNFYEYNKIKKWILVPNP